MIPFRENAHVPVPPPEEDTSAEWLTKLRADSQRRARFVEIGTALGIALLGLAVCLALVAFISHQIEVEQRCSAAGGTYIRGVCLAVKELRP